MKPKNAPKLDVPAPGSAIANPFAAIDKRIAELSNARNEAIARVNQLSGAILELQRLRAEQSQNGRLETNSTNSDSQPRAD